MKEYTIEQIAHHLSSLPSFDNICGERFGYFLHVDREGNLIDSTSGEAECFVVEYPEKIDDLTRDVYDQETLDNPIFRDICDKMTCQVNDWIADNVDDADEDNPPDQQMNDVIQALLLFAKHDNVHAEYCMRLIYHIQCGDAALFIGSAKDFLLRHIDEDPFFPEDVRKQIMTLCK